MSERFLGVGWKFPVGLDGRGGIALSRHEEDVREAIWVILSTAPGERLMHPELGCGIHDYVFAPNNAQTAGQVAARVEEALVRWEPRIELEGVDVQADPDDAARLLVRIDYRVRSTDSRFNLVYPFYLERGEEA
jgi:hypothetical protein